VNVGVAIVALVALVFGFLRFVLPVSGHLNQGDVFKDLAHVFVGLVIGLALATRNRWLWGIAVGLTVLEVVAFVARMK
jgi:hypothetical protein